MNEYINKYFSDGDVEWVDVWWENRDDSLHGELNVISCGYSGNMWIGKTIVNGDDYGYLKNGTIDLNQMQSIDEKIKTFFPDKECVIHYGTYGC